MRAVRAWETLQGLGRHSFEHIKEQFTKELAAVNTLLEGHEYITGSSPSQADCFLWAAVEGVCHLRSLAATCAASAQNVI